VLLESLWKQNLYKTMPWFIYLAKLRTDLLDNRSLAILLETYKLLICYTLVFGQPLSKLKSMPGYGIPVGLRFACALFENGGVL
jgi:hypothetical protein